MGIDPSVPNNVPILSHIPLAKLTSYLVYVKFINPPSVRVPSTTRYPLDLEKMSRIRHLHMVDIHAMDARKGKASIGIDTATLGNPSNKLRSSVDLIKNVHLFSLVESSRSPD